MSIHTSVLVIQSATTGNFLLHQQNEEWQFAVQDYYEEWSPLSAMMQIANQLTDNAGLVLTYTITKRPDFHLYHCWVEGEPLSSELEHPYAWYSLFNFPIPVDQTVTWAFREKHFMEVILDPNEY